MAAQIFYHEPIPVRAKAIAIAPDILRIVANNPSKMTYHGTNTYIVHANDGTYVIDPGPAEDSDHYKAIIANLGEKPVGILVTHHHSDHFGSAPALRADTGMPVFASREFPDDAFVPDRFLEDGDVIGGLTVLHTPGHASDHICFSRPDGVLFTGDHVMTWSSSMVGPPDGDMGHYCQQLSRLLERQDTTYLPGHGPRLDDPKLYVSRLLDNRTRREVEILHQIAQSPETIPSIATTLYRKSDPHLAMAAERNVAAHLQKLRNEGLAALEDGKWHAVVNGAYP